MRSSWSRWAAGVCVLGALSFAIGDEPAASEPGSDEMRSLRAENRVLAANLRALRAEVDKLKAENAQLREKLKQAGLAVEAPSLHEPAPASQEAPTTDVAALAALLKDYAGKKTEIATSQMTQAQKQAAYKKAEDDFTAAFGRRRLSVAYTVEDVAVEGDDLASIQTGPGRITPLGSDVAVLGMSSVRLQVRLSKTAVLQVKKNASLVVVGTLALCTPFRGYLRAPDEYAALGYLYPDPAQGMAAASRMEVAVRDGRQFTLEGSRLEVTKITSAIANLAPPIAKPPKRPPGK